MNLSANQKFDYIQQIIATHDIVLFMKGTPQEPQCGFSFQVVQALNHCEVNFHSENVLANEQLRADLKQFSEWPTFPQLYVKGNLVGGCDIVSDLQRQNKLHDVLHNV